MLWTANRTILFDLHIFHTINDWSQSASLKGLSRWWRTATNKEKWSLLPFWQQAGQKSTIETKIGIWTGNTKICWKKTPTIYKWMKKQCTDAKPKIKPKFYENCWKKYENSATAFTENISVSKKFVCWKMKVSSVLWRIQHFETTFSHRWLWFIIICAKSAFKIKCQPIVFIKLGRNVEANFGSWMVMLQGTVVCVLANSCKNWSSMSKNSV